MRRYRPDHRSGESLESNLSHRVARGYIISPESTQDRGGIGRPSIGRNRHDRAASLKLTLVILGLVLRDSRSHQCTDETDDAGPGRRVR